MSENQPNINQSNIGCYWQLIHDTEQKLSKNVMVIIKKNFPNEEICCNQHNSEVDSQSCLKVKWFKESCCISDQKKEEGGEVGGQQLIGYSPLQHNLHLETSGGNIRVSVVQTPALRLIES